MTRIVEIGALTLGGAALFGMSFVGFSVASCAPMHEVAVIGGLFELPEGDPEEDPDDPDRTAAPGIVQAPRSMDQVLDSQRGVLSAFDLPPAFSEEDLRVVVEEVKSRLAALDAREIALDDREGSLAEREAVLEDRLATLDEMKAALEALERELNLREQEVGAVEANEAAREASSWDATAKLFDSGDVDEQVVRLQQFPPDEAAEILKRLKPTRAADLLAALPTPELWREYQDAYSAAAE